MKKKVSWNQKLEASKPHRLKRLDKNFAGMKAGQMMLLPSPKLIDEFLKEVAVGTKLDAVLLRKELAKHQKADVTCPIATGFAIKIVAEAAFEKLNQGTDVSEVTPVWRVLDKNSSTLNKVSFDKNIFLEMRAAERAQLSD